MKLPAAVTSPAVRRAGPHFVGLFGGVLAFSSILSAQTLPPINGVTGTIARESTVEQEHLAGNKIVVKTIDGVKHLLHHTKDLLVHGGKGRGPDALQGLREGTTVAVHYMVADTDAAALETDNVSDEGLSLTEGTVIRVDRRREQITVWFDNRLTETLQLTVRAEPAAGTDVDRASSGATRIAVYYTDDTGRQVAHHFAKVS